MHYHLGMDVVKDFLILMPISILGLGDWEVPETMGSISDFLRKGRDL